MCGQISARKARKAGKARTARHKTEQRRNRTSRGKKRKREKQERRVVQSKRKEKRERQRAKQGRGAEKEQSKVARREKQRSAEQSKAEQSKARQSKAKAEQQSREEKRREKRKDVSRAKQGSRASEQKSVTSAIEQLPPCTPPTSHPAPCTVYKLRPPTRHLTRTPAAGHRMGADAENLLMRIILQLTNLSPIQPLFQEVSCDRRLFRPQLSQTDEDDGEIEIGAPFVFWSGSPCLLGKTFRDTFLPSLIWRHAPI